MPIQVTGQIPRKARLITGWTSFDRAFMNRAGEIGLPLYKLYEMFGPQGVGKTTIATCIAAKINSASTIEYGDLEGQDADYVKNLLEIQKFTGTLNWLFEEQDEVLLDKIAASLQREETACAILDSIGAISPIAERQSSFADTNMGRRAQLLAKFTRSAVYQLRMRQSPAVCFMLNHQLAVIGSKFPMTLTPGGDVKKFLCGVRIKFKIDEKFDDDSYTVRVIVEKNRMGFSGREAKLFILAGEGVHTGMTAVIDCIDLKIAKKERTIELDGKSYGYLKNLIGYAGMNDPEPFVPFLAALQGGEHKTQD